MLLMSRPPVAVTRGDANLLDGYANVIDKALDAFFSWTASTKWQPTHASPQQYERRCLLRQYGPGGSWDGADAQIALGLGSLFVILEAQYLEGIRALLLSRQVIVPLAPPVRSCFEAACRVAWLLEPREPRTGRAAPLPIRDRAARVQAVRLEDLTRRKTVAVSLGDRQAPKFGGQVRDLRRKILPALFYTSEIADESGELVLRGQRCRAFARARRRMSAPSA